MVEKLLYYALVVLNYQLHILLIPFLTHESKKFNSKQINYNYQNYENYEVYLARYGGLSTLSLHTGSKLNYLRLQLINSHVAASKYGRTTPLLCLQVSKIIIISHTSSNVKAFRV